MPGLNPRPVVPTPPLLTFELADRSLGDLIIFDMDFQDVTKEVRSPQTTWWLCSPALRRWLLSKWLLVFSMPQVGNQKVFCQSTSTMELAPIDTLDEKIRAALNQTLELELVAEHKI